MEDIEEDVLIENFILEHIICFDRFTFDDLMRFLLSHDYSHEDAKDFIIIKCMTSALVMQERIYNNYYTKISISEKISEDLLDLKNEIFNDQIAKYYFN